MQEILIVIVFFLVSFGIFIGGLVFSQYKKRQNAGCCGGTNCSDGGSPNSCYKEKEKFVDNYMKSNA